MPYDHLSIPVISPTSGPNQDGLLLGRINSSDLVAAALVAKVIPIQAVKREDLTATGSAMVDVTTAATDAAAGDFQPFGTTAQMSLGDSFYFYVADGKECDKLHVQIATPGVGTYTIGIQEWDATAEAWVDMADTVDNSNNFKAAAGVYIISWTHSKKGALKLHHTDTAKHVWHRVYLKTFTSASTAPVISRLWAEDVNVVYTDMTAQANSGNWTGFASEFLPTVNAYSIWVHPGPPMGSDVNVTTAAPTAYTTTREYYATDGVWKPVPNFVDPSNDYRVTGTHRIRWSRPADWTSKSLTIDGTTLTGWVERRRIVAISTPGPVMLHQTQTDSRALGAANAQGIRVGAGTYNYVTFSAGANTATVVTVVELINVDTGAGSTISIPVEVTEASDITGGRVVLSTPMTVTAGQSFLVRCLSGGPLLAVGLRLHG